MHRGYHGRLARGDYCEPSGRAARLYIDDSHDAAPTSAHAGPAVSKGCRAAGDGLFLSGTAQLSFSLKMAVQKISRDQREWGVNLRGEISRSKNQKFTVGLGVFLPALIRVNWRYSR